MSLSKRDTFVRYVDPKRTMWQDADGNLHLSLVNALKAFDLEDTPENRQAIGKIFRQAMLNEPAVIEATIVERAAPDSPDYWTQVHPDDRPPEFRDLPYQDPTT